MIKKFFVSSMVVLTGALGLLSVMPSPQANAAACANDATGVAAFLSFPSWYRGLCDSSDPSKINLEGMEPGMIIITIAMNIIDIALRAAAIIAVGYVIYGGFRYLISQGEPDKTKNALDTILKAVIGLAICMISAVVVSFLAGRLSS